MEAGLHPATHPSLCCAAKVYLVLVVLLHKPLQRAFLVIPHML